MSETRKTYDPALNVFRSEEKTVQAECSHLECDEFCQYRDSSNKGAVNHPRHYNIGKIEVIDAIDAWGLGFDDGNAVKYIARARHKGKELEDLEKALWYLEHRIDQIKELRGTTHPPKEIQPQ